MTTENKLLDAINHMESLPDGSKVDIGGKLYAQVTTRVVAFRKAYGDQGRITTKVHVSDQNRVQIEAQVHVRDGNTWHLIANDWAEELRNDGFINKKSATENCATSAIGRALAACGLGGGEYASGDEVKYAKEEKTGVTQIPEDKAPAHKEPSAPVKPEVKKEEVPNEELVTAESLPNPSLVENWPKDGKMATFVINQMVDWMQDLDDLADVKSYHLGNKALREQIGIHFADAYAPYVAALEIIKKNHKSKEKS